MTEDHSTPSQGEQRREGEMIERVAMSLLLRRWRLDEAKFLAATLERKNTVCSYQVERTWSEFLDDARAAIEAMREPTEEMIHTGHGEALIFGNPYDPDVAAVWRDMIDAALSTVQGDKT